MEEVRHPEADLLKTYVEENILVHTVLSRSRQALERTIANGPHALA